MRSLFIIRKIIIHFKCDCIVSEKDCPLDFSLVQQGRSLLNI